MSQFAFAAVCFFPPLPHQDAHNIGEMLVEGTRLVFVIQVRRKGDDAVS